MHFSLSLEAKGKRIRTSLEIAGLPIGFRALPVGEVSFDLENFSERNCISFLLDVPLKC